METTTSTQTTLRERVEDLNRRILNGEVMEAFEEYYADDVVQQENEQVPTRGKDANRRRELDFLSSLTDFRSAEVKSVTVDEENSTSMVEWYFDYTHRDWGDRKFHQVSVQRWRDGQIVHERYYYGS
ncbi:MAG: ester cyclase [Rhodothermia bacterium]|nr:ester cyclase [Rhodothermia bacterium]